MIIMNKTIETQLNHKTIRKFKNTPVSQDTLNTLLEVANRTASSNGMQSFSIIRVTDPEKRQAIAKVCNQHYVEDAPELLIFIVDAYRNAKISEEMGEDLNAKRDMDRFFQGFTDGCIAAQNIHVALESLGMGAVYLGSILNDAAKIIEILELPKYTFPILGTGFGYPDEIPTLKPRMDLPLKVFENKYVMQDSYLESIKDYDKEFETYFDLRVPDRPLDAFSSQVVRALSNPNSNRTRLLHIIRDQGFDFQLD